MGRFPEVYLPVALALANAAENAKEKKRAGAIGRSRELIRSPPDRTGKIADAPDSASAP